ncbi:MAG: hypothetical protein EZS28_005827, partial [Streblomastix strix]
VFWPGDIVKFDINASLEIGVGYDGKQSVPYNNGRQNSRSAYKGPMAWSSVPNDKQKEGIVTHINNDGMIILTPDGKHHLFPIQLLRTRQPLIKLSY